MISWDSNGLDSADGTWGIQVEHVRDEGTWAYLYRMPAAAQDIARREHVETHFAGNGCRARARRSAERLAALVVAS